MGIQRYGPGPGVLSHEARGLGTDSPTLISNLPRAAPSRSGTESLQPCRDYSGISGRGLRGLPLGLWVEFVGTPCCPRALWLWWAEQLPPAPRCGEGGSLAFLASPVNSCPCSHPGVGRSNSPQQPSDVRSWRGGPKGTCPLAADRTGEKLIGF